MNCKKVQSLLSLYLDHQLSEKEEKEVKEHISKCQLCQEELYIYETLIQECSELNEDLEVPSNFHTDLMSKIRYIEQKPKKKAFKLNYAMFTTVAAIFVFALVLIMGNPFEIESPKSDNYTASPLSENHYERTADTGITSFDLQYTGESGPESAPIAEASDKESPRLTTKSAPEEDVRITFEDNFSIQFNTDESMDATDDNYESTVTSNESDTDQSSVLPYILIGVGLSVLASIYFIIKRRS